MSIPLRITVLVLGIVHAAHADDRRGEASRVASEVAQYAHRHEAAEVKPDLVRDRVQVSRSADGHTVIEQTGEASIYGDEFQGRRTANGERFDNGALSAAHPTLPFGSAAKVTNLDTGRSVNVEISDRGPYVKGRDIDLSEHAAEAIGLGERGVAPVKIEARLPAAPSHP